MKKTKTNCRYFNLGRFAKGQKVQTKVFFNIYSNINIMFVSILSCKYVYGRGF